MIQPNMEFEGGFFAIGVERREGLKDCNHLVSILFLLKPFYASFLLKKSMVRCQARFAAASS